jgi:RNA polymerase sigma-70 factor, ECF subfamily
LRADGNSGLIGDVSESAVLTRAFVAALPKERQAAVAQQVSVIGAQVEAALENVIAVGKVSWPTLKATEAKVAAFIARNVDPDDDSDITDLLASVRAADIYLAASCLEGVPGAVPLFDQLMMGEVDIALARMRITGAKLADVKQLVRQRLFVGVDGAAGKIIEYGGRGDLRRWVRSVAVRTCLNEMRKHKREIPVEDQLLANHALPGEDPRLAYMKQTYAAEFKVSFAFALGKVTAREQTLLRYHHVDGLNIDEIGAIYRVHRVTAFRWLEKAKEQLVTATLADLKSRLNISAQELDSVLRMIRSAVHLSLIRNLGGPSDRVENDDVALELGEQDLEEVP